MGSRFFEIKVSPLGFSSLGTLLLLCAGLLTALPSQAQSPQDSTVGSFEVASGQSQLKDDDNDDDDNEGGSRSRSTTTTTTTTTVTQTTFTDVSTSYWASDFVYRLSRINVVSGFPNGQFLPGSALTHAQFAAIVSRAFQQPTVREAVNIRSLSRNYWAYQSIQKAYSMGFVNISNGTFNANQTLTRLDMLVQLARGLGITQVSSGQSVDQLLSVFTDANTIPSEYRVIVAALVERGILVNYPQVRTLNLSQTVSRAEACSFVYQALAYLGKVEKIQSAYVANTANLTNITNTSTTNTNTTGSTTTTSTASSTPTTTTGGESISSGDVITLSNGYRITLLEVTYSATTSTWRYYMEELPQAQDLSNWVLGLPSCARVVNATPRGELANPDPNAQISGIKWQPGGGFTVGEFSVTLEGQLAIGQVSVAAKGPDVVVGTLSGPSCNRRS